MSEKVSDKNVESVVQGFNFVTKAGGVEEYLLKSNHLRVLFLHRPGTGVSTTNITYLVGARDESRGETGVAHMLEHMMFKPTEFDIKNKITSGSAMQFERNTGCVLNANTWRDRTTYYFSYPAKYFTEALQIESERMQGVVLTDESLKPEQNNVLSEFDMYNGDPHFALSVSMCSAAYSSHPYGHETIGFREDIEDYTAEKLERFYRNYYRPDNAVLMVIGDVDKKKSLKEIKRLFGNIKNPSTKIPRFTIREPKQEGLKRIFIERPSTENIVSIGFKHAGFPTKEWFITGLMLNILTSGPESILHKLLIDTGKVSSLHSSQEPTSEQNLATISINLSPKQNHAETEELVLKAIKSITSLDISSLLKKNKAGVLTDELFARTRSMHIVQELTEYVSSGDWEVYAKTAEILKTISQKDISKCLSKSFINNNMTIGHFTGKA